MSYVDGFVVPVKKTKLAEYRRLSRKAGKVWGGFADLVRL